MYDESESPNEGARLKYMINQISIWFLWVYVIDLSISLGAGLFADPGRVASDSKPPCF